LTLVSNVRYRNLTGDLQTPEDEVTEGLADAQREVEEYLRRPLESLERTESLRVYANGRVYPKATPITAVPDGYTVEESAVVAGGVAGAVPWPGVVGGPTTMDLTYTGGYDPLTLPRELERAICETAFSNMVEETPDLPSGVTSARVGDASVTFQSPTGGAGVPSHVRARIKRWRRARVPAA
jgi:hypothetical protein